MPETPVCRVCGASLLTAPAVYCARCATPHHRECWDYGGRCSTYGCGSLECSLDPPPTPAPVVISEQEVLAQDRVARERAFVLFLADYPKVASREVSVRADRALDGVFGWISGTPGHDGARLLRSLGDGAMAAVGAVVVAGTVPLWYVGYLVVRFLRLVGSLLPAGGGAPPDHSGSS